MLKPIVFHCPSRSYPAVDKNQFPPTFPVAIPEGTEQREYILALLNPPRSWPKDHVDMLIGKYCEGVRQMLQKNKFGGIT